MIRHQPRSSACSSLLVMIALEGRPCGRGVSSRAFMPPLSRCSTRRASGGSDRFRSVRTALALSVEQRPREKRRRAAGFRARDLAAGVFACSRQFSPSVKRVSVSVKRPPASLSPLSARSGPGESDRAPAGGRDLSPLRAGEIAIEIARVTHVRDTMREKRSPDHVAAIGAPVHQLVAALETRRNGSPAWTRTTDKRINSPLLCQLSYWGMTRAGM